MRVTASEPDALALRWQPVWQPFLSELSAKGFAQRLARLTGLDYRVSEAGRGRYEVAVAYSTEDERDAHLARIESVTGLSLSALVAP